MKVTVKDCLVQNAFKDALVLATPAGITNEVKQVSVMDAGSPKDVEALGGNQGRFMLTSFPGLKDDIEGQCALVEMVAKSGCAALAAFHVGEILKEISPKLIEAAEKSGVTLIQMSEKAQYHEAISEIMDIVLYGESFRNSLIGNTVFHLLNFEKHSNFPDAIKEAAINNEFQLFILSEEFNPVLTIETRHRATIADAIRMGREHHVGADPGKTYTQIDVNGVLTYWGPVTIGNDKYFLLIVDNEDVYTAGEITKLAEIIELAMGMWKYTPERDVKADFIKALVRGNKSLAYNMQDEARIEGGDIVSVFFAKGGDKKVQSQAFTDFEVETDMEVKHITEEDETYGMILKTEQSPSGQDYQACCTDLFNTIKENRDVRLFHVTGLNGIEGAGDAYKLISESWAFAQNVFPYKRVFTKYELTLVNNCINIQIQGGFVKKNYTELLEPFKAAGENKGKQLMDTLEAFVLDAGMNSSKTAEIMGVHVNTVQYRLKKINEMLGVEITGKRTIPGLTMALALKRLERAVS